MPGGRAIVVAALVALAAPLAACGSGPGHKGTRSAGRAATPAVPTQPGAPATPEPELALPDHVPEVATGPADRKATRVINAWLRALRHGDIKLAASYFATPSKVQNSTPVLTLESARERRAFNISLPCGAVATASGGAGSFTIVKFRLTERVHGDCMGAAGHPARCAIRVSGGKIVEWYRLRDSGGAPELDSPSVEV